MFLQRKEVENRLKDMNYKVVDRAMRLFRDYIDPEEPDSLLELRIHLLEEAVVQMYLEAVRESTDFASQFMATLGFDWGDMREVRQVRFADQSEQYRDRLIQHFAPDATKYIDDLKPAMRIVEYWLSQAHEQYHDQAEAEFRFLAAKVLNSSKQYGTKSLLGQNYFMTWCKGSIVRMIISSILVAILGLSATTMPLIIKIWSCGVMVACYGVVAILIKRISRIREHTRKILDL